MICETGNHKYILARNESYWYQSYRYGVTFVCIDFYFCEKCLNEQEKRKSISCLDHEVVNMPDWAKVITTRRRDLENQ